MEDLQASAAAFLQDEAMNADHLLYDSASESHRFSAIADPALRDQSLLPFPSHTLEPNNPPNNEPHQIKAENSKKRSLSSVSPTQATKKQRIEDEEISDDIIIVHREPKEIPTIMLSNDDDDDDDDDAYQSSVPVEHNETTPTVTPKSTKTKTPTKIPPTPSSLRRSQLKTKKPTVESEEEESESSSSSSEEDATESDEYQDDDGTDIDIPPATGASKLSEKQKVQRINTLTNQLKALEHKTRELKAAHKKQLTRTRKERDERNAVVKSEYDAKIAKWKLEKVEMRQQCDAVKEEVVAAAKREKLAIFRKYQDKLNEKQAACEKKIEELKGKKDDAEEELKAAKAEFRDKLREAKGDKDTSIKEMRPEHSRIVKEKADEIGELRQEIINLSTAAEVHQASRIKAEELAAQYKTVIQEKQAQLIRTQGQQVFDQQAHERTMAAVLDQYRIADEAVGLSTQLRHRADVDLVQARRQSAVMCQAVERLKAKIETLKEQLKDRRVMTASLEKQGGGQSVGPGLPGQGESDETQEARQMSARIRDKALGSQMEAEKHDCLGY